MSEESFDNTAQGNTAEKSHKRRQAGLKGAKTNRTVGFRNFLGVVSTLFFAACFVNIRHWTSLLLTLVAVGCGGWAIKIENEHRGKPRPKPLLYGTGFCVLGLGVWLTVLLSMPTKPPTGVQDSSMPSFHVSLYEQYVELENPRNMLLWNINGRAILSPIHAQLLLDLTNLRKSPITIKSYQFEGKTPSGTWEAMPLVDLELGKLVWLLSRTSDLKDQIWLKECGPNVLPQALKERRIAANDTITTFAFLEAPGNGFTGELRLRIRYANDSEEVQPVSLVARTNLLSEVPNFAQISLGGRVDGIRACPNNRKFING